MSPEKSKPAGKMAKNPKVKFGNDKSISDAEELKVIARRKSSAQTLFVKVSSSNAEDTHAELIKKFSNTSKDIRTSRWPNQFYVEFENPETMEANKESLESLEVV